MKILLYGSTHLTSVVYEETKDNFEFVGYVPSKSPRIPGIINLPRVQNPSRYDHDIKLSIQYDRKILDYENAYNIHTGLLPEWGGSDILYHTLNQGACEQGITFHKMTSRFDYGPIISKITYPVFENDTVLELYERMFDIIPCFVYSSLKLLKRVGYKNVNGCQKQEPIIYKRSKDIKKSDQNHYQRMGEKLVNLYGVHNA
jgi:methionyl-tRNA formyltransferase